MGNVGTHHPAHGGTRRGMLPEVIWTEWEESLLSPRFEGFPTPLSRGDSAVPLATPNRQPTTPVGHCPPHAVQPQRNLRAHRPYLCLAAMAIAAGLLLSLAGCQTPQQPAAYGAVVPPPGTGMINQPAPYGGYVSAPQGAAYPPTQTIMPGPGPAPTMPAAPSWQSAAPQMPAAQTAPPANSWTWANSGQPTPPPSLPTYGAPPTINQAPQNLSNQAQQYANQVQAQPQQWANQTQQQLGQQQQQLTNQLQNTANQYQQGASNQLNSWNNQLQQNLQAQQQALSGQMQQATNQMQQAIPGAPQQQTANGWWPFTSPAGMPPARTVPAQPVRY